MNRSACHRFSVPRVVIPILVAFCVVGALAIPAAAQDDDEAKVHECWDVMRQYARYLNDGDTAAAYKLLAPPVQAAVPESAFQAITNVRLEEAAQMAQEEEVKRQAAEIAKAGPLQASLILRVEKPEIEGRTAIAGVIIVTDARLLQRLAESGIPGAKSEIETKERALNFWSWLLKSPPWGAQLETLGLTPEDCDLVDDPQAFLGDPETSHWFLEKDWIVASLRDNGQWVIVPPLQGARTNTCAVDARSRECLMGLTVEGGGGVWVEPPPFIAPRPSLTHINYVCWTAVETDPPKCPKCGEYMRSEWKYCPCCGAKLDTRRSVSPGDSDQTPEG
jgi:hypothetical protein